MPWWQIFKKTESSEHGSSESEDDRSNKSTISLTPTQSTAADLADPEVRKRRSARLQRRIRDLEYDIALAESAHANSNRWKARIEELNQAIEMTRADIEAVETAPGGQTPVLLPDWPVKIKNVQPEEPSEVTYVIGDAFFRYSEEIDWAERGHQRTELQLRRFEGNVDDLIPSGLSDQEQHALREHLTHSTGALAAQLRHNALEGNPEIDITLADMATPCPDCPGWRDLLDRCLQCQRRAWEASELRAEVDRLIDERNGQLDEEQRWREALPILRRQLQSAVTELEKYR